MTELPEDVRLSGFHNLDEKELQEAQTLVGNFAKKISVVGSYEELRLELKLHEKIKSRDFEIIGAILFNGFSLQAQWRDKSPFIAIEKVLSKLLEEAHHKLRN